ncbi:DUF4012 domain-containing protein [Patescibacteria group bacterium]
MNTGKRKTDLLRIIKPKKKRSRKPLIKMLRNTAIVVGGLVVALIIFLAVSIGAAKDSYNAAIEGKTLFERAQEHISNQEIEEAVDVLSQANEKFIFAEKRFGRFRILKVIPFIGRQISAIDNTFKTIIPTGKAIEGISQIAVEIFEPFNDGDTLKFSHLSKNDKRAIFKTIDESQEKLSEVRDTISEATKYFEKIPDSGLIQPLKDIIIPFKEQFPQFQDTLRQAIELSDFIPRIVGYPQTQKYLFLLQNNTEMRPTGGFIGTYGVLKISDGEIDSFETDNVYNLDSGVHDTLFIEPPWPLTRYNNVHQWFLRDANWSPHFPTSAKKALEFYQLEGGKETLDGVIAITPTFIESLLALTGDITVDGITFTKDNFTESLQYEVEQGFLRQGIPFEERKEIIGTLSEKLMEKVLDLPRTEWGKLWSTIAINLAEKHALLYIKDDVVQEKVASQNWAGEIREYAGDYLMVIDANLASLKSDPAVKRSIEYSIDLSASEHVANVSITYTNEGKLDWKTTRYRTYVRVYVPNGSNLISSNGSMIDCNISDRGSVEVSNEEGRVVFGTFLCTEIGESKTLTFTYTVPDDVIHNKEYKLLVQKQAGTINHTLKANITLPKKIDWVEPFDKVTEKENNEVSFEMPLRQDRHVLIRTK